MYNDRFNNLLALKAKRKNLRSNLTPSEATLWIHLKGNNLGKKFRRQHSIDHFILDFYCPELQLAIELDGSTHNNPEQFQYDNQRTSFLQKRGINVVRFKSQDVIKNLEGVLEEIKKQIRTTTPDASEDAVFPSLAGGDGK